MDGTSLAVPAPVPGVGTREGMSDMVVEVGAVPYVGVAATGTAVGVTAATTGAVVGVPVVAGMATGAPVMAVATGAAVGADLQLFMKIHKVEGEATQCQA
jgi:hypothetical protein